jgi:predicted RNA-binding Zn-ribbon protein involved in translation (DUF1610 family)
MAKFRCKNCNYQFETPLETAKKSCPNCGEVETIRKEQDALELLEESD